MPIVTSIMAKRLVRWQLAHTAPAHLRLEHPVQIDLAEAADEIEKLHAVLGECEQAMRLTYKIARPWIDKAVGKSDGTGTLSSEEWCAACDALFAALDKAQDVLRNG